MNNNSIPTPKANILVVDDTRDNLRLLSEILVAHGYTVRPVPDGALALSSAQAAPPDLILLDIMMPDMSGYEVCEKFKADERMHDIPVIFISALNEAFDKVKAFAVGGVDYVTKPFQAEEVLARVEIHLALRNLNRELYEKNAHLQQEISERKRAEMALKGSVSQIERAKREWESTADSLSYVVCLLDRRGRIIRANRAIEYWNLGQVVDVKGREMHELFHPDCPDPACSLQTFLSQAWEEVAQGRTAECEIEDHILHRYMNIQVRPISALTDREYEQLTSFAVGIVIDITERKWAEEVLQQRNRELEILNQMSDSLHECRTEEETYSVVVNMCKQLFPSDSGCLSMMNASRTELNVVASWGSFHPEYQTFGIDDCLALSRSKVRVTLEPPGTESVCPRLGTFPDNGYMCAPINPRDGILGILSLCFGRPEPHLSGDKYKHILESKRMVISRVVRHYALALTNLRLRETLRQESIHDPLTGLYNRRYMEATLEREARRAGRRHTPVGIIMIDIDHFKMFNDTHGHEAGDIALQKLGELLQRSIRGGDIACRYGGEEFLLILPETVLEVVEKRAKELLLQVRTCKIPYQGETFHITVSMGVAALPNHGPGVQKAVSAADTALYQAKGNGRDQIVVASLITHGESA